ncbi:MAG: SufE family protein [Planctomycetes bacterium]|nr:SufE family protein [Planctomycetota bacterium]
MGNPEPGPAAGTTMADEAAVTGGTAGDSVAERLARIADEFADLDSREKLELLVEYAASLPPLPAAYAARRGDSRVHECQTPVFLWPEVIDGRAGLVAEVAPEAPTVKGFVAVLAEAVAGRPATEAAALDDTFIDRTGLTEVLGILRSRGLRAILARVRKSLLAAGAG